MSYLSFTQTLDLIANVGHLRTVVVEGENGIGKTALFHALKKLPQFASHIAVDPVDCTQLSDGSVWMPDLDRENGISRELPNERFGINKSNQRGVNGAKPVLLFLDEIAKAPQFIKNVLAPIVYERRVGNYHLPEGSVVFCATNLGVEGLGDSIQAHLRNRLVMVKMRKATHTEILKVFSDAGVNEKIQAYVKMTPPVMESFIDYEASGMLYRDGVVLAKENGRIFNPRSTQTAYASPRSLVAAGDILDTCDGVVDDTTLFAALAGTIGETTAAELMAFVKFGRDICSFDTVVADPTKAPLSTNPTAQLVQVMQFVSRVDSRAAAESVLTYVERMKEEIQSIFINTLSTSSRVHHYVTLKKCGELLAKHKVFFTGV